MASSGEVASRYGLQYSGSTKKTKGLMLDKVVASTGWSRDYARRKLVNGDKPDLSKQYRNRRRRKPKFSPDARRVLQRIWFVSGGQCGKYLVESMPLLVEALERHNELVLGVGGYSLQVRAELLAMSPATIDRYLTPARTNAQESETPRVRPAISRPVNGVVAKGCEDFEEEPGFFKGRIAVYPGTDHEEVYRRLTLTCVHTGWTYATPIDDSSESELVFALREAVGRIPFGIMQLDLEAGNDCFSYRAENLYEPAHFVDSSMCLDDMSSGEGNCHGAGDSVRPHVVENADQVHWLRKFWSLRCDQINFFTPTKKAVGWEEDREGVCRRLYDKPSTPLQRLLAARVLSRGQESQLLACRDALNPVELAKWIDVGQRVLKQPPASRRVQ